MSVGPVLRTSRLLMDMHRIEDFDDWLAMLGDADIMRHIGNKPLSRSEIWARILRKAGSWSLLGIGSWTVREAASGRFVGDVGFADLRREITPRLDGVPEMGWVLAAWSHGKGYATEAVRAALAWGDATLAHPESVCLIDPPNATSLRVAEKAGYRASARGVLADVETIILKRRRAAQ